MTRESDIETVCNAVLENWEDCNSQTRWQCNYCSGCKRSTLPTKFINGYHHALDCPVLVAQDLLTEPEEG